MSYSQDGNSHQKSLLRKKQYTAMLDRVIFLDNGALNLADTINKTECIVDQTQILLKNCTKQERVECPGENLFNSRVVRATTDLVVGCADRVSGNSNPYDANEVALHLKDVPVWNMADIPYQIPRYSYLYGAFAPGPQLSKAPKQRKHVEKQKAVVKKTPENVTVIENKEEGSKMVTKSYNAIDKYYKKNNSKPISYFKAILDPDSFSRTIENIYHLSFLVRDGMISIDIDEKDGLPYVTPISRNHVEVANNDSKQFIMSFTMKDWKEAVEAFEIKETFMKR